MDNCEICGVKLTGEGKPSLYRVIPEPTKEDPGHVRSEIVEFERHPTHPTFCLAHGAVKTLQPKKDCGHRYVKFNGTTMECDICGFIFVPDCDGLYGHSDPCTCGTGEGKI